MNKIFEKGFWAGKVCPMLTGVLLFLVVELNAQVIEYGIIRDVSESTVQGKALDANDIFRKLIVELELRDSKKGVNFRTALCGESTIPEVRLASLEEQTSAFGSSSQRDGAMRQFLVQTKADLDFLISRPCDESQTNLYRAISHVTTQVSKSATSKTLVVLSDLAEVSSVFNAKLYEAEPSKLMDDYHKIVKVMEQDSSLPDLSGFTILLITPGTTDMHLWLSRFWTRLLESKNARVEVRAAY